VALYWKNPDPRSFVNVVPTSAITGEGIPDLLQLIVKLTQTMMGARLQYSPYPECRCGRLLLAAGSGAGGGGGGGPGAALAGELGLRACPPAHLTAGRAACLVHAASARPTPCPPWWSRGQ
jgi:hypothetical protein